MPNTGVPGSVMGYGRERVIYSPAEGFFSPLCQIGDMVKSGDILGTVGGEKILAPISGIIRGLIHPSVKITVGLKMADIDPRGEKAHCFSISDKALAVGGGVLEAVFYLLGRHGIFNIERN